MREYSPTLIYILLLVIVLAACSPTQPQPTEIVVVEARVSPTPLEEPNLAAAQAALPTAAISPDIAKEEELPQAAPTANLGDMSHDTWFSISPSGAWTVQVQVAYPLAEDGRQIGDQYYVRMVVFRQDGSQRWQVLDEWRYFGLGYTLPAQFHWTEDETYLFYTEHGVPDGCPTVFGFDCGLVKVSLQDGSSENLVGERCGAARVTRDGSKVALLQHTILQVIDLEDDSLREFAFSEAAGLDSQEDWQAGGLIWSPDARSLVFTILFQSCAQGGVSSSILLLNLDSGEFKVLVDRDAHEYVTSEWRMAGRILLYDAAGVRYWLELEEGGITPVD